MRGSDGRSRSRAPAGGGAAPSVELDHAGRVVTVARAGAPPLRLRVPALFGAIRGVQPGGDEFIVVLTEGGRVSFHAREPDHVGDVEHRRRHPMTGKIHWHSLRKALREHCLRPDLASRVSFHLTHHAYASGARSSAGASGRITIDGRVVCRFSSSEADLEAAALGAALAAYLELSVAEALVAGDDIVRSVALLDRRLSDAEVRRVDRASSTHPLWRAAYELRASVTSA